MTENNATAEPVGIPFETAVLYRADGRVFVWTGETYLHCPFSSPMPPADAPEWN